MSRTTTLIACRTAAVLALTSLTLLPTFATAGDWFGPSSGIRVQRQSSPRRGLVPTMKKEVKEDTDLKGKA